MIAVAFADLVAEQDKLDKSIPTRKGEQKRERTPLGGGHVNRHATGKTTAEPVFSPAEAQSKSGHKRRSAEKGTADTMLTTLTDTGVFDRARAGLASTDAKSGGGGAKVELPGNASVRALSSSGLWK